MRKGGVNEVMTTKLAKAAALTGALLVPVLVFAQTLPTPTNPVGGTGWNLSTLQGWIMAVAQFLIAISVIIAVIFIIWGGVAYMTAGADEAKATAAKSRIKNGVIGAIVVMGVGVILATAASVLSGTIWS